ncbi:aminopeptidase P family protein [Prevotella sp. Rep29]|uniref:aminopeptidase P family protein n=1 Tax=Prevotella sp. Rep29 TaxID=2691580 RepID=UPI001C6F082C|nr:aminopeptidase P family protein [Prevotella sp. Rep29]QYR11351.1 M24 family metallopeptidase [Prevotella sp. Rep29]
MKETISNRLAAVREVMRREHLAAFVFPSTDPHNSEYVPDHWKGREWISGFDGSAGTAVVTMTSAALWTDSRYFIAAAEQLGGTEFVLMKERLPETPTVAQWLGEQLRDSDSKEVGIDGMTCAYSMVEGLIGELRKAGGLTLRTNLDILAQVWTDRPSVPLNEVVVQPLNLAGEPAREKISRIRQALRGQHADGMLVTALDDIAWTLNLRGSDVHCNPVFVAYLLISSTKATLFVDRRKLTAEALASLKEAGIDVDDYGNVQKGLKDYFEYNILLDPDSVNYTLYKAASSHRVVAAASPVPAMKAVKNDAEIAGFHEAMLRDGIAMVKFLKWLKPAVAQGGQTEMSIVRRLYELRSEQPLFRDISFDTIAAYQEHGAIVHYEPTEATDMPLKAEGLLLIDSGAQYQNGTTDITRTVALGPLTEEQRRVYTLVLKGHIQLDMLTFPDGASGTQLDALARKDMWAEGYNYLHGTGHGVGSYLNVHEGPHQIRMEYRPAPLHAGMTVTDEPGIYLEGQFGVRIENTLLITPFKETAFGKFLRFEALTLCPIDTEPIVREMMTDEEVQWLNSYHHRVREALSPHLSDEERAWLDEATKAIG